MTNTTATFTEGDKVVFILSTEHGLGTVHSAGEFTAQVSWTNFPAAGAETVELHNLARA